MTHRSLQLLYLSDIPLSFSVLSVAILIYGVCGVEHNSVSLEKRMEKYETLMVKLESVIKKHEMSIEKLLYAVSKDLPDLFYI